MYIDLKDLKGQLCEATEELAKRKKGLAQAEMDVEEAVSKVSLLEDELSQCVEKVVDLQQIERWLEENGKETNEQN